MKNLISVFLFVLMSFSFIACTPKPNEDFLIQKVKKKFGETYFELHHLDYIKFEDVMNQKVDMMGVKFTVYKATAKFQLKLKEDMICRKYNESLPYCKTVAEELKEQAKEIAEMKKLVGTNNTSTCPAFSMFCKGRPYTQEEVDNLILEKQKQHKAVMSSENYFKKDHKLPVQSLNVSYSCEKDCGNDDSWKTY